MPVYPNAVTSRFRLNKTTDQHLNDQIKEIYSLIKNLNDLVPIGTVILSYLPLNPSPEYFLPCDGRSVPVAEYRALAAACPFMVSSTDSTVLIIPDERGKFPQFTPPLLGQQAGQTDNRAWQSGTGYSVDNLYLNPFIRAR